MNRVPAPPYDDRPINPYTKINCGVSYGSLKANGASVDHSMYGTLSGTDAYFRKRDICSLTPWGIGGMADGALDGKIYRWMDYHKYSDVVPWSSGPWIAPGMGDGPAYVAKWGVAGINGRAQAIETSDGGRNQYPMTVKQWHSLIWLKAYIAHTEGVMSEDIREVLAFMHHREFCIRSGKDCPFPRIYNFTNAYLNAVVVLMQYFEGKHNDLNKLMFLIGNLTVDLRNVGRLRDLIVSPVKPTPAVPIFQDFTPNRSFKINVSAANVRQWASTDSKILMTWPYGRWFVADGFYYGQNIDGENRWLVMNNDPRGRIWAGLVTPSI